MPTIDSAIQKIASQSTKSGRNRNSGYIGKRDDCGISGGQKLVIFSMEGRFLPVRPPVITNVYSYQETEKAADFARKWKVHMEGIQNFSL